MVTTARCLSWLSVDKVGHSRHSESNLTMVGCVDQALSDEAGPSWPQAPGVAAEAPRYLASTAAIIAVYRHRPQVVVLGLGRTIPTGAEETDVESRTGQRCTDSGMVSVMRLGPVATFQMSWPYCCKKYG